MTDETSLDITGVGKLAKAIPQKAWVQLVDTACTTFREVIAPITSLTGGVGRLIEAKFDALVDAEKVLAADTLKNAHRKATRGLSNLNTGVKAAIVIAAIEGSSSETDPIIRELWSNLLAQEFASGGVHPEFPRILSRLSASDAQVLAQIADKDSDKSDAFVRAVNSMATSFSLFGVKVLKLVQTGSFTHEHLKALGLIQGDAGACQLTLTGKAFIEAVSDVPDSDQSA